MTTRSQRGRERRERAREESPVSGLVWSGLAGSVRKRSSWKARRLDGVGEEEGWHGQGGAKEKKKRIGRVRSRPLELAPGRECQGRQTAPRRHGSASSDMEPGRHHPLLAPTRRPERRHWTSLSPPVPTGGGVASHGIAGMTTCARADEKQFRGA